MILGRDARVLLCLFVVILVANVRSVVYKRVVSEEKVFQHLFADSNLLGNFPFCLAEYTNGSQVQVSDVELAPDDYWDTLLAVNQSALHVNVQFSLMKLIAVSERDETVTLDLRTETTWTDCRLAWNPQEMNQVKSFTITPDKFRSLGLFVPGVFLREEINQQASQGSEVHVHLFSSGQVVVIREYSSAVFCDLDLEMYPFDHHACYFTFEPPYNSLEVNLTYQKADSVEEESWQLLAHGRFTPNKLWEVVVLPPQKSQRQTCSSSEQDPQRPLLCLVDRLAFRVVLVRHPAYQVINLFTPAFLCMMVSASIYIIPNGASDKTFLMLCILLSTFWFSVSIYDRMPDTGSKLSWMSIYYFLCICIVSFNCIVCAVSTTIASSKVSVPACVSRLVLRWAPALLRDMLESNRRRGGGAVRREDTENNLNNHGNGHEHEQLTEFCSRDSRSPCSLELVAKERAVTWHHVAACLDRVYFAFLFLFSVGALLVFLLAGYNQPSTYYTKHIDEQDWPYVNLQLELQEDSDILKQASGK